MEKKWIEEIRKSSNEELLRYLSKNGSLGIEALKETLRRGGVSKKHLRTGLQIKIRLKGFSQKEEIENLKAQAVEKLSEGILEEEDLLTILDEVELESLREEMAEKFLSQRRKIRNYVLTQIIRRANRLKNRAAKILLEQEPSQDDLLVIEEECQGDLQLRAFKIHKLKGLNKDDGLHIVCYIPALAALAWKEIKDNLTPDDLLEIAKYSDSEKVNQEATMKMLKNLDELSKEHLIYLFNHPKISKEAKEEVGERLLDLELELEELLAISQKSPLEFKAKKLAIRKAEEEIQRIEKNPVLSPWQEKRIEKRIEELKALIKRLKNEIEVDFLIAK